MKQASKPVVPRVYDLISNSVSVDSLSQSKFEYATSSKPVKGRVIPRSPLMNGGTVNSSVKPVPVVENVGSMYHHPNDKVGRDLLKQKALRSVASLPDLMERLLKITPRSSSTSRETSTATSSSPIIPPSPSIDKRPRADTVDSLGLVRQESIKKVKADDGNQQGIGRGEIRRKLSVAVDDEILEDRKKKSRPDDALVRIDDEMVEIDYDDKFERARVVVANLKSIIDMLKPSSRSQIGAEIANQLKGFRDITEKTSHMMALRKISLGVSKLEKMLENE